MLTIACLSQKGGVGKSTMARLIARTYAAGGWNVKIADFNVKQKTSVDWSAIRMSQGVQPEIPAEAFIEPSKALKGFDYDLVVIDGKPDADVQTLRLAQDADMIVIPTGVSADDLVPQVRFGQELKMRGIPFNRIMYVLNKTTDSLAAVMEARSFIKTAGFNVVKNWLPMKTAYINAHNVGRCLSETEFPSLNTKAELIAQEIVENLKVLSGTPA